MIPPSDEPQQIPSPPGVRTALSAQKPDSKNARTRLSAFQAAIFHHQTAAFLRARLLVRVFYACSLYFAVAMLSDWPGWLERGTPVPLWPVAWLTHVPLRGGVGAILILDLVGALLAAAWPEKRWARALFFLGLFECVAFNNSYGKIGHSLHLWVLVSGLLVFLPDLKTETPSRLQRQKFLLTFWAAQAMVMLIYSMSGLGKFVVAIYQLCAGQANAFTPGGLAAIVAERLTETNSRSLLGPWLIDHPFAGWPLMLGDMYLQLFALWAVFRPSLHRLWAVGLILFHIGSYLLLTISFPQNALLLALFFLNSPFRREHERWRHTLGDLPLFGRIFRCAF